MARAEYFSEDIFITGKHSQYIDDMWTQNKIQESMVRRAVDLYLIAAIIGLRIKRKANRDTSVEGKRTIQLAQVNTLIHEYRTVLQMVLILDETENLDEQDRVNRAFRPPETEEDVKKNMELFHSYALGGIEKMYEMLVERKAADFQYTGKVANIMDLLDDSLLPDV